MAPLRKKNISADNLHRSWIEGAHDDCREESGAAIPQEHSQIAWLSEKTYCPVGAR